MKISEEDHLIELSAHLRLLLDGTAPDLAALKADYVAQLQAHRATLDLIRNHPGRAGRRARYQALLDSTDAILAEAAL